MIGFKAITLVGSVLVLGLIGKADQASAQLTSDHDLINRMSYVCHAENTAYCQGLIGQVEAKVYEVLSNDQGYYWAEVK